jgi:ATP phosphoribosyltransferase regulatory subunit
LASPFYLDSFATVANWLLPEYIADVLPAEARRIEELRRRLLDGFRSYGYEQVIPPLLEYLDSLLTGVGRDLDLRTFKLVDQVSGRTMGLRADITPQVARIDAHLLNRAGVTRLCYYGSVLHTRPSGLFASREPLHIGAEIYGHAGIEADLEIVDLLLTSLSLAGLQEVRVDLSHIDVLRALVDTDPAAKECEAEIYALLEQKNLPELHGLACRFSAQTRDALAQLAELSGGEEIFARARAVLPSLPRIEAALATLEALYRALPAGAATVDLAEVRGYRYHSGVMFSAYCAGLPNAVARGGRYDDVGKVFGRARPATGFSLELRELASLLPTPPVATAVRAPWRADASLHAAIRGLRGAGEIVVQSLPGHEQDQEEFVCDRQLVERNGQWIVERL